MGAGRGALLSGVALLALLSLTGASASAPAALASPASSEDPASGSPAGGAFHTGVTPHRTGEIRGTASINQRPPRRRASRYSGRTQAAKPPQTIPTVVYLKEAISGAPARASGDPVMPQQDTTFVNPVLFIPAGTEVAFPNQDPFFHNVFSYSPAARFDLGRYPQGESKSVTFDEVGEVAVFCEVHETMRALIVVTENPFHTTVAEDGSFSIPNVPAGTYTLVITHSDLGSDEQVVRVEEGEITEVELTLG